MVWANQLFQLKIDFILTIIGKIEALSPGKGTRFAMKLLQLVKSYKNLSMSLMELYQVFLVLHHAVQDALWSLNPSQTDAEMYCMQPINDKLELDLLGGATFKPNRFNFDELFNQVEEVDDSGDPIERSQCDQCMYEVRQYLHAFERLYPTGRIPGLNAEVHSKPRIQKKSDRVIELEEQVEVRSRRDPAEHKIKEKVITGKGKHDDPKNENKGENDGDKDDTSNGDGEDGINNEGTKQATDLVPTPCEIPPPPPALPGNSSAPNDDSTPMHIVIAGSVLFFMLFVTLIVCLVVMVKGKKKAIRDDQGQSANHE